MIGYLLIDKPEGYTSHDVVAIVRRTLGVRQVGHTGTLDPIATGVLPICVGRATRMSEYLLADDKEYTATLQLGIRTDTYDRQGEVLGEAEVSISKERILDLLTAMIGRQKQVPPMFSAKKVGGKKLYDLARQGIEVERKPNDITIHALELIAFDPPLITIRAYVSKGTYIRSIVHDIGETLGCGAMMTALQRTRSGPFRIDQCTSLESLQALTMEEIGAKMLPIDTALLRVEAVRVKEALSKMLINGREIDFTAEDCGLLRVYDEAHNFLGPGKVNANRLKLIKVMI